MKCQACDGRATVFLCGTCTSKLRELLNDMPWWLEVLSDAAVGHVKLGDGGGGRTTARREPFKGEDGVLPDCTCGHREHLGRSCFDDQTCLCDDYQPAMSQAKMRAQFLAAGGVNARASMRLDKVRNSLTTTVRHLGETRGITFVRPKFIGPLLPGHVRLANTIPAISKFLADNVNAIACDETAGECLGELQDHVAEIEKLINRPVPMQDLGNCPTWNEHTRRVCGTELRCREGIVQVTCPNCRKTYNAAWLQLMRIDELNHRPVPWERILKANRACPEGFQVLERTLRRWRKNGPNGEPPKIKIRGYRRPDGSRMINRHSEDDEPLYLWSDVTKARSEKPERKVKVG